MPTPGELGKAGSDLWRDVAPEVTRKEERSLLLEACRTADELARMAAALRSEPATVEGSMGQPAANPLLSEVRGHRESLRKLLAEVGVTSASRAKMTQQPSPAGKVPAVGKLALLQGEAQKRKTG